MAEEKPESRPEIDRDRLREHVRAAAASWGPLDHGDPESPWFDGSDEGRID
jgi:hypothetical protein